MLPRLKFPFEDQVQTIDIAKHIFSFFNCHDLRVLPLVCKDWHSFIKDTVCKVDAEKTQLVDTYKKFFKLYYHDKAGFLLNIDMAGFFVEDGNGVLKPEVVSTLPFIKEGSECNSLAWENMYFWSPTGFDFYQLAEVPTGQQITKNEKVVCFSTTSKSHAEQNLCRIKFLFDQAVLLEPEIKKPIREEENNIVTNLPWNEIEAYIPLPPPEELMVFDQCPQRAAELLLQLILAGNIKMLACEYPLELKFLAKFDEKNLLLVLTKGNKHNIKIRKDNSWQDVPYENLIKDSSFSGSMSFWFSEESEIIKLNITNPSLPTCKTYFSLRNSKEIKLTRLEFNTESCAELSFLNLNVEYPRPTPLDILEKLDNKNLSLT